MWTKDGGGGGKLGPRKDSGNNISMRNTTCEHNYRCSRESDSFHIVCELEKSQRHTENMKTLQCEVHEYQKCEKRHVEVVNPSIQYSIESHSAKET